VKQRRNHARQLLFRIGEDDWDTVIDTNLKGAFLVNQARGPGG